MVQAGRIVVAALALLVLVGACSSEDDDGGETSGGGSEAETTSTTTSELPDQASPAGANGIKVDAAGDLWIASLDSDVVLRVDPETGEILSRHDTPAGSGPDDVVIDDAGAVYWTGYLDGSVGVVPPAEDGGEVEVLAEVGEGANPIAIRGDGDLVVGRAVVASGLFVLAPEAGAEPEPLSDPGALNSFDINPDGVLYGPLPGPGAGLLAVDAETGETLERLDVAGAAFGVRWHEGRLYVLSLADAVASVFTVDPETGASERFGDTDLGVADNLAVAEDGTVYVTGFDAPVVAVLDPEGEQVATLTVGAG